MAAMITVYKRCTMCGVMKKFVLDAAKYDEWHSGRRHIQDVWPEMSSDDREVLISGTCPKCWNKLFGGSTDA